MCCREAIRTQRERMGNTKADIYRCVQAYTGKLHKPETDKWYLDTEIEETEQR